MLQVHVACCSLGNAVGCGVASRCCGLPCTRRTPASVVCRRACVHIPTTPGSTTVACRSCFADGRAEARKGGDVSCPGAQRESVAQGPGLPIPSWAKLRRYNCFSDPVTRLASHTLHAFNSAGGSATRKRGPGASWPSVQPGLGSLGRCSRLCYGLALCPGMAATRGSMRWPLLGT